MDKDRSFISISSQLKPLSRRLQGQADDESQSLQAPSPFFTKVPSIPHVNISIRPQQQPAPRKKVDFGGPKKKDVVKARPYSQS